MKAFTLNSAGTAENLKMTTISAPGISDNEVLIKVKTISLNPVDIKARLYEGALDWLAGGQRPVILGWDIAGVITEKGRAVANFEIGDEVFGMVNFNIPTSDGTVGLGKAYAEYVAAPASHLAHKPKNISYEEAAASTLAALTAWQALVDTAKIKKGEKVLIHAAAGGVGHFAVQIAKYFGAYVIGTSSAANKDFVLSLGADEHIDYREQSIEDAATDIDVVLDSIGGETLLQSITVTKEGGRIITLPSGDFPQEYLNKATSKNINLQAILVTSNGVEMEEIASLLRNGKIKAHIQQVFPFSELPQAHQEVEKWRTRGKIIIAMD